MRKSPAPLILVAALMTSLAVVGCKKNEEAPAPVAARRYDIAQAWVDFTDRPAYSDAEAIARIGGDLKAHPQALTRATHAKRPDLRISHS